MTDDLVIVDVEAGSFAPTRPPRHDAAGVVARLRTLAGWVRARGVVRVVAHQALMEG